MGDTARVTTEGLEVDIPITVCVSLDPSGLWSVEGAFDMRTGESIGDIGVHDFDGFSDFRAKVRRRVLRTLDEYDTFAPGIFYSIYIQIKDGGSEIGSASWFFWGPYIDDEDDDE